MPASVAGGRYQLRRFLGEGAKKRVYLARDARLDSDVALALVKTEGLDVDGLVRVNREAQAMGRLRDHPHVVPVFDIGQEAGQPYIVSQYLEGGALDERLHDAEGHRLPLDEALRIAEQVCRALEHAHASGIVHRDLKPGNIWLAKDGTAKLGDFGLAVALDRSRITQQGTLLGTVAYMAPEQAVGGTTDARSDLYGLGATLYEMVTGRPPFLGDDAVAVISQHLHTAPVAPSWHSPELPAALEALILALLHKDPNERPKSAAAVAEELRRIAEGARDPSPAPPLPRAAVAAPRAAWGRFVGRHEEMERLKEALESALSGRGSLVMLAGEPGIGKTRLAEEFAVYARLRGAQALVGRSYEGNVEVPYLPLVEAFRQYVRARPDEALREELGEGAPELATLVSEVRQRFPDIPVAPRLEGDAERLRLFESVAAFVRNAAGASPLVLLLDDLHWADKPTLLLLRHLTRDLASLRVLVVATYRDVELDRAHPLAEVLATLRREPVFQRVLLRGLPEADVEALVFAIAEDDPDPETAAARRALAEALHRETEGNPFFIGEVLRHLAEEGKIYREGGRWRSRVTSVSELGIPEGVREVVGRRLSRLSDACNRFLTIASAMPAGFSWQLLASILGEPEATSLDLLDEGLAARLVQERKDERGGTYEFTHAIIRQTLYEELSTPRRVLLHRRIGEALESMYGDRSAQHAAELAHHFFHAAPGGDVERAIDYAVAAAERATSLAAFDEAAAHYERALQALDLAPSDDPARRCHLLLALAQAHLNVGAGDRAREAALQAASIARLLRASDKLALAALRTSWEFVPTFAPPDEARLALLEEALAALGPEQGGLRARVLACLATAIAVHAPERAAALSGQALDAARSAGEPEALACAVNARHSALGSPDYIEERVALADELLRAAKQVGMTELVATAHSSRHFDLLELGDAAAARGHLEAYEALARETRLPGSLWLATVLRTLWAILEGRFEEAERLAEQARARAATTNMPGGPPIYAIQIARVRAEQGRLEEMGAVLRAVNEKTPHAGWRSRLAQIYAELGREADARREFEALAADDFASIGQDIAWLLTIAYLAEVAAFLRDEPRAERLYQLLLPHERRNINVANAAFNGPVSRPLGLLAASLGRFDDAVRHFEDAIAMNERLGAPALLARVRCDYARMLLARGAPGDRERGLELAQHSLAGAQKLGMKALLEKALATKLAAQGIDASDTKHSIYAVASALQRKPPELHRQAAPDGTVTLMFSDLEGFTQLTERLGDRRAHEVVKVHNAIVREQCAAHGGYEVELQGDGFLLAFASARQAVLCATAIQRGLAERSRRHPDPPLRVRIGLHTGEAIKDADKFFGKTVIQAYRIADRARAGEILVSSLLKELVESGGDLHFDAGRDVELKGLSGAHRVFAVEWA